jgi:hypothetical protein
LNKPKLTRVTDWHALAFEMYRRMFGHRCVACFENVMDDRDAEIYRMNGGTELMLVHRKCRTRKGEAR